MNRRTGLFSYLLSCGISTVVWATPYYETGTGNLICDYDYTHDGIMVSSWSQSLCGYIDIPLMLRGLTEVTPVVQVGGFQGCSKVTHIVIPETVKRITQQAFSGCGNLISVNIPPSVTFLGAYAFEDCYSLESCTVPSGVETIYASTFMRCSSLSSVRISEGVSSIGDRAFSGCWSLKDVSIPTTVTSIGESAFSGCSSLEKISLPSGLRAVSRGMFRSCDSLTSVIIPDGVSYIGYYAFSGCTSLTDVLIPRNVPISDLAFYGCEGLRRNGFVVVSDILFDGQGSKGSVVIPSNVVRVAESAFFNCTELSNVAFPEGLKSIGAEAFSQCTKLTHVTVTRNITQIDARAFSECELLNSVDFEGRPPAESFGSIGIPISAKIRYNALFEDEWSTFLAEHGGAYKNVTSYWPWPPSPEFNPESRAVFDESLSVSISAMDGATIYYTLDGSVPTTRSTVYTKKFRIFDKFTVKAIAVFDNGRSSDVAVAEYGKGICEDPVITLVGNGGFVHSNQVVAISWTETDGILRYTLDGRDPTENSQRYDQPFVISDTTMVKAKVFSDTNIDSHVVKSVFRRNWLAVDAPVISANDSFVGAECAVSISCGTVGSEIYYTTDGSMPTIESQKYVHPFAVTNTCVIKAMAVCADYADSIVASRTIERRWLPIGDPVICTPTSFSGSKALVEILCPTEGATVYYSLDGAMPNDQSLIYRGPFYVTNSCTVWALAVLSNETYRGATATKLRIEKLWTIGDAVNAPDLQFKTDADNGWIRDNEISHDGKESLRSGMIGNNQISELNVTVDGACEISFWMKISCEDSEGYYDYDRLEFHVDDDIYCFDGEHGWTNVVCHIETEGSHKLRWVYVKDATEKAGSDCVWIDEFSCGEPKMSVPVILADPIPGECQFLITITNEVENAEVSYRIEDDAGHVKTYAVYSSAFVVSAPVSIFAVASRVGYRDSDETRLILREGEQVESIGGYTWTYTIENTGAYITTGKSDVAAVSPKPVGALEIPERLGGVSVAGIGGYALCYCSDISSVDLPSTVLEIGDYAFYQCRGLKSITLPNGIKKIGRGAFSGCSVLQTINIPQSVDEIEGAFYGCVGLGDGVVSVDDCILTVNDTCPSSYNVPSGIRLIAGSAFASCTSLRSVSIADSVRSIGSSAFSGCSALTTITIPQGVTNIGSFAFNNCVGLKSAHMSPGLARIGYGLFWNCTGLTSMTIPNGVTSIDSLAYYGCSALSSITIPSSVVSIGSSAFGGCTGLGDGVIIVDGCVLTVNGACPPLVELPKGTRLIAGGAFRDREGLHSVTIPDGVTCIGDSAFTQCYDLETVTIPASVTNLGDRAFYFCSKLTSLTIPNGVKKIGSGVFYDCMGLTTLRIPDDVTSIGKEAFLGCRGLTNLTLSKSLIYVGDSAFQYCVNMTSIVLPEGVSYMGSRVVDGCSKLNAIYFTGNAPECAPDVYSGTHEDMVTYVTLGSCGWSDETSSGTLPKCWPSTNSRVIRYWPHQIATFDPNGGELNGTNQFEQIAGSTYTVPNNPPVRAGYAFNGWWTAPIAGVRITSETAVVLTRNITLYAHWNEREYIPDIGETATAAEVAAAVADATDPKVTANIDVTNYNDFRTWAGKVKAKGGSAAGAQGVMSAENAWMSYALGQGTLLDITPTDGDLAIESFEPAAESGKFDFTVSVKDIEVGSEATKENLKKVFGLEGAATLDGAAFSSDKVDIEFATPVDGNVRFTAGPKDADSKAFFMKVKLNP